MPDRPPHAPEPEFSVVTVNYNNADLLSEVLTRTLDTLARHAFEVIVVDNGSTDGSLEKLTGQYAGHPFIRVINSGRNGGFGYGCNVGASHARSRSLWFLNSDAWVSSAEGLGRALALLARPTTGMVGTSVLLNNAASSPQGGSNMTFGYFFLSSFRPGMLFRKLPAWLQSVSLCVLKGVPGVFGQYANSFNHSVVSSAYESRGIGGASFFIRGSVFSELNGFDETFFLYDEDGDLCLRCIDSKLTNYIEPAVHVLTYPSATTSKVSSHKLKRIKRRSRLRLISKHFSGVQKYILLTLTLLTWRLL